MTAMEPLSGYSTNWVPVPVCLFGRETSARTCRPAGLGSCRGEESLSADSRRGVGRVGVERILADPLDSPRGLEKMGWLGCG